MRSSLVPLAPSPKSSILFYVRGEEYLKTGEFVLELGFLVEEFFELGGEHYVGHVEAAELLVVVYVVLLLLGLQG